jgi:hypothetical protein
MGLGSTQPLTEMSTKNLPGGVKDHRRVRLTTLPPSMSRDCLEKMWEPRRLTILWAFTACYRDRFTFYLGYDNVLSGGWLLVFRRSLLPPSSVLP